MPTGTERSLTEIMALLDDNITGDISPQDMRDAVETLHPGHGEIYITTPIETSITSTTSWFATLGTFALTYSHGWDMATNGQLRFTDAADRVCHIACSWSMTCASNNETIELAVTKNGLPIEASRIQRRVGTGGDVATGALHAVAEVVTGDYLSVAIRNITDTTNVTLQTANLFVMDIAKH